MWYSAALMANRSMFLAAAFTALAMFAPVQTARAQSVDQAQAHWFEADFDAARTDFEAILASAELSIPDALTAHRYLAALDMLRGDEPTAKSHAEAALALDPAAEAPDGAPRSTAALFASARSRMGGSMATLSLEARPSTVSADRLVVEARLVPAPSALTSTIVVRCGVDERTARADSVTMEISVRGSVPCTAEARTEHGAVLFRARASFEDGGGRRGLPDVSSATSSDDTSGRRRRIGWIAGASTGAVVVSVVLGIVMHGRNADAQFGGTTVVGW